MTLIDDCRHWWKLWSVRLAMLAGIVAGAVTADPDLLKGLVSYVPEQWRPLASLLVGVFVFVLPTLARLIPQPKLHDNGQ